MFAISFLKMRAQAAWSLKLFRESLDKMADFEFEIERGNAAEEEDDDEGQRMVELRPSEPGSSL